MAGRQKIPTENGSAGDTVTYRPVRNTGTGATADTFLSHFTVLGADPDGSDPATWLEPVTGEQDEQAGRL